MFNFTSAVVLNSFSFFFNVIRTFIVQIIIGLVIGLVILSFPAHAAGYPDPLVAVYGKDYTSWDVWMFYAKDSWKFIAGFLVLIIVFPVAGYIVYKEELRRYKVRKDLGL